MYIYNLRLNRKLFTTEKFNIDGANSGLPQILSLPCRQLTFFFTKGAGG